MKAIVEGLLFLSGEDGLTLDEISSIIEKDNDDIQFDYKATQDDFDKF